MRVVTVDMHKINPELIQDPTYIKVIDKVIKKPMFLSFVLLGSLLNILSVEAQEPAPLIQFNNGEAADANDVNSNFNNHEQRLQALEQYQGCSAAQDGSSVVITCADGSSGVLASAGTVIVYPEGSSPPVDLSVLKTGDLVLVDANDKVLTPIRGGGDGTYLAELQVGGSYILANIYNDETTSSVVLDCYACMTPLYYTEQDCKGQALVNNTSYLLKDPEDNWLAASEQTQRISQVASSVWSYNVCANGEYISTFFYPIFPYVPPAEIINAAYPVRASQLP
jgi:hypothetical protein